MSHKYKKENSAQWVYYKALVAQRCGDFSPQIRGQVVLALWRGMGTMPDDYIIPRAVPWSIHGVIRRGIRAYKQRSS